MMNLKSLYDNETLQWKVKRPSHEYRNLPEETRSIIDEHVSEFPVKLGKLAKRLGVKVLLSTLPRGISGQISQGDDGQFIIKVNRHEAKHRQRFTLAHELAHYILHRDIIEKVGGWSEGVLLRAPNQPMEIEYQANRLASDLVMPSDQLTNVISEYQEPITSEVIDDLAGRFGVSTAAMEIKLQAA